MAFKTNINVGGILSSNWSISGTMNDIISGDLLQPAINSELKALFQDYAPAQSLQYPQDLDNTHYILFQVTSRVANPDSTANSPQNKTKVIRTIALPLPLNLTDQRSVNYSTEALGIVGSLGAGITSPLGAKNDLKNMLTTFGADAAKKAYAGVTDLSADIVDQIFNNPLGAAQELGTIAGAGYLASKLGMLGSTLAIGSFAVQYAKGYGFQQGIAFNPRMAVMFDNVNFREFQFNYRMIARNPTESEQIKKIVREFQQYMMPSYLPSETNSVFVYPNEFQLSFSEKLKGNLFEFLPCVLKSVSVSYNGESGPAFFEGTNAPLIVDLGLQFQETKILTNTENQESIAAKYNTNVGSEQTNMLLEQEADFLSGS